jgi:HSP20 family protein
MAQKQEKAASEKKSEGEAKPGDVPIKRSVPEVARRPLMARHLPSWERDIDRWFDDVRRRLHLPSFWSGERWWPADVEVQVPALDVYETDEEVVLKAEMPGLSKDQIEVSLTDTTLTVTGEKKKTEEVKEQNYYRSERSFGSFSRTVHLPAEVKSAAATATLKDGVLEVRLPKTDAARRKAVKVKVD